MWTAVHHIGFTAHSDDTHQAPDLQVLTKPKLLKLSSFANTSSKLILRDTSVAAVLNSVVQYSTTSSSGYDVSFQDACVADIVRGLGSCMLVPGKVGSVYRR